MRVVHREWLAGYPFLFTGFAAIIVRDLQSGYGTDARNTCGLKVQHVAGGLARLLKCRGSTFLPTEEGVVIFCYSME